MDLKEQGSDRENPKAKKIKKRMALLQKLKLDGQKKDELEYVRSKSDSDGSEEHKFEEDIDISMDNIENAFNSNKREKRNQNGMSLAEIENILKDGEDQLYLADVDLKRSNFDHLIFKKTPIT